ncbi:MAG TPA: sulfotransferase domain-containing protein [Gammaproteobacteria bacterium]|nr:sulfotransferase domain-containing protein [Gammaproteobacteria bacterium]
MSSAGHKPHRKPRYTVHGGFRMPMGFPPEGFESALTYVPEPGDVFVSTYPKCGTTWMQYIVYLIVHRGEPLPDGATLVDAFPHLEEIGAEAARALPRPRLLKTHLPLPMAPFGRDARYVFVARNPFDCAVSFYYHTQGFVKHYDFAEGTFDDFFECFIAGEVDFGDYFEHLVSWYARRGEPNVLVVTYEDMRADPGRALDGVARFRGPEHAEAVADLGLRSRILEHSSFAAMSRAQGRWSSARPAGSAPFVRKGVVGDWRAHFSSEQARRLAERFRAATGGAGAYALWPDIVAAALEH